VSRETGPRSAHLHVRLLRDQRRNLQPRLLRTSSPVAKRERSRRMSKIVVGTNLWKISIVVLELTSSFSEHAFAANIALFSPVRTYHKVICWVAR
jgi:hypothetical protein